MTSVRCLAFACLCLVLPAVAAAQATSTAPAVELQGPYLDRKAGFSIQYPVGTDRQRVTSSTNLVQWVCRDAATNAVSWAVTVQRAVEGKDAVNVKAYASTVVDKLAKSGFKSEYLQIGELAGKDMFEIAGASTVLGKVAFWQRQVWVQDQPGAFLIVLVSGPVDAKDKLDAIFRAVTPTLKLYDAAALLKAQEESLHRGKEFLAGLQILGGGPTPPVITQQPQSQTNIVGGSASFDVTVSGTAPLSYQWNLNGTNIVGATNATLTLNPLQLTQAGNYSVLVSNLVGSTNSAVAILAFSLLGCTPPPAGIVAWWPAEGNVNDNAGANNGTLLNGASFAAGEVGQAFLFGTPDAGVKIPANPTLDVGLGGGVHARRLDKPIHPRLPWLYRRVE